MRRIEIRLEGKEGEEETLVFFTNHLKLAASNYLVGFPTNRAGVLAALRPATYYSGIEQTTGSSAICRPSRSDARWCSRITSISPGFPRGYGVCETRPNTTSRVHRIALSESIRASYSRSKYRR